MTEHDMLLMVQRQRQALVAERDALREQVAALVAERDALRTENGLLQVTIAVLRSTITGEVQEVGDGGYNAGYGQGGELG